MRAAATNIGHFLAIFFAPELRAWQGKSSLGLVFWIYGIALSSLLAVVTAWAFIENRPPLLQLLIIADFAYTLWVLVAIWRCSTNAHELWGGLARWLTIAWGLNTIFVLWFIEIELAVRYLSE